MATQGNTSRLAEMQMRFQQKQQQVREQKKSELTGSRAVETTTRIASTAVKVTQSAAETKKLNIGTGKVRQMFVERRQRVTGIDKSYPLPSIQSKSSTVQTGSKTVVSTSIRKTAATHLNNNGAILQNRLISTDEVDNVKHINGNSSFSPTILFDDTSLDNEKFPEVNLEEDIQNNNSRPHSNGTTDNVEENLSNSMALNLNLRPIVTKKTIPKTNKQVGNGIDGKNIVRNPLPKIQSTGPSVRPPPSARLIKTSDPSSTRSSASTSSASSMASKSIKKPPTTRSATNATPPENTKACKICGRFFNEDRLEKHESICQKTTTKKRKIFDATKHRVKGTEAEQYIKKSSRTVNKKVSTAAAASVPKKSDWRRKHEEFIEAIRSAKQVQAHIAKGGKLSDLPPPPPSENPDYVQCPHCQRKFNQSAAERHIPKCANFQFNKPKAATKSSTGSVTKKRY